MLPGVRLLFHSCARRRPASLCANSVTLLRSAAYACARFTVDCHSLDCLVAALLARSIYEVCVWAPEFSAQARDVPALLLHADGNATFSLDQTHCALVSRCTSCGLFPSHFR